MTVRDREHFHRPRDVERLDTCEADDDDVACRTG
jgi:hypothetical protein